MARGKRAAGHGNRRGASVARSATPPQVETPRSSAGGAMGGVLTGECLDEDLHVWMASNGDTAGGRFAEVSGNIKLAIEGRHTTLRRSDRAAPRRSPWPRLCWPHRVVRAPRLRLSRHAPLPKTPLLAGASAPGWSALGWHGTRGPARVLTLHDSTTPL